MQGGRFEDGAARKRGWGMQFVILSGLPLGSIYSSVALVYNLMYSTTRVLSITAGFNFMIGGVLGAYFFDVVGLHPIVRLISTLFSGGLLGLITEVVALRRRPGPSAPHLFLPSTPA